MSTRVVVTGGSGFLGSLLARRLLTEPVTLGGTPPAELDELTMIDLVGPPDDVRTDRRVRFIAADLSAAFGDLDEVDAVFHLAGVVSGAAEADFDLGMHTNIDGTRAVLEYGRRHAAPPLVVFSSSLAVFGSAPAIGPVGTWTTTSSRGRDHPAHRLGLREGTSFDDIVRAYLADNPGAGAG